MSIVSCLSISYGKMSPYHVQHSTLAQSFFFNRNEDEEGFELYRSLLSPDRKHLRQNHTQRVGHVQKITTSSSLNR